MFFHIDESGNSGNNLFDEQQPVLSYGVLSSLLNVDVLGTRAFKRVYRQIGVDSLHANVLGHEGLRQVAGSLYELQRRFDFRFDYYFIHKRSFAATTLFNAVFDSGINPAMKWDWYWTPMRFPLVAILDHLLDDDILRESWRLCLVPRNKLEAEQENISALLMSILKTVEGSSCDKRMREVLRDALHYGIRHPSEMDFGIYSNTALSPNTIGFQFVLQAIASRQKAAKRKAMGIIVDRQSQFNPAQIETYEAQSKLAAALRASDADREYVLAHPLYEGVRDQQATLISHFPVERVTIKQSDQSFGLQLADTYLWLTNRIFHDREIPAGLSPIVAMIFARGNIDGISVAAMMGRFEAFEKKLPVNLSGKQLAQAQANVNAHRAKIRSLGL